MIEAGTYRRKAESAGGKMELPPMPKFSKRPMSPEVSKEAGPTKDNDKRLKEVYDNYISEMKKINEPTDNITFDFMKKAVGAQQKKAEERYGTKDLNFKIKEHGRQGKDPDHTEKITLRSATLQPTPKRA